VTSTAGWMHDDRQGGAALVESLLVALFLLVPLLSLLTGLARVQQASQAVSMAAREGVRAATTAPRLSDWEGSARAAVREVLASQGFRAEPVVELDSPDGPVGRGRFVTVSVSIDVDVVGPPVDAVDVRMTGSANGRVDPFRADCIGAGCR